VADLRAVGVAQLHGGQGLLDIDLDDRDVGVLVDADDVSGTTLIAGAAIGIGGELHVDAVGLIDDVIVGDNVTARVHDEAGAEGASGAAAVAIVVAVIATLAAEEAVEEVLHVPGRSLLLAVIVAVGVGVLLDGAVRSALVMQGRRRLGK